MHNRPGGADAAAASSSGVSEPDQPSTTVISTVAVQAGKAKIVLAILKSHDWIRVRIQQMEPDIMEVGATLEEAKSLRREHDEILLKLNQKQKDLTELLARADDLAVQNTSYQEVYSAMAKTLAEAWKDLNKQLEYRKMLLDQSIAFHESAVQFSHRMEDAQDRFSSVGLAHDVESVRHMLQQHQDLKRNILESSLNTLQEGQLLLDRIREMGVHAHVQNRHATTAACYGIENLLELLQDRRRHLEELWLQRKVRLEQCLQLLLLDREVNKVSDWYEKVGDAYLNRKEFGDSLTAAQALQDEHIHFEQQAKDIQETILRLIRTADQLIHSASSNAEAVHKRLQTVNERCEGFMHRLGARRKQLALARNFFTYYQAATTRLDEIEIQVESTDLTSNTAALAERHSYLSHSIVEAVTPAFHEGHALLERVGKSDPGTQGVSTAITVLQERSKKLEEKCKAQYEAGEQSQALNQYLYKYNGLNSWLTKIVVPLLGQHTDMGANFSSAQDFLELHERFNQGMKNKATEVASLSSNAEEIAKLGTAEATAAAEKANAFREQWQKLHTYLQQRIRLALSYVAFHKKAQQLAVQMDALQEYLRIEKLDASQVSDSAIKHKEDSFKHLNSDYTEVEHKGKHFIKEANEVKADEKFDTRRAIVIVETILSHFSERKFLITEYYEHWKVHITTGKTFKAQWHQFVQDARKTIDWMVKEEKDLFVPYSAGFLGRNAEEAKKLQEKVDRFGPTARKAQEEVEKHLKTSELLSLQGDTQGQSDHLINELLRVHTRFQARVNEYQILLKMAVLFFHNLAELDKLIEKTENEYAGTELPKELATAELLLREHVASRNRVKHLIDTTADEGEEIVVRVRQTDLESAARDEVQKVLKMTEERRRLWERTWEEQRARLELNLQMCQFYFDLRQLHAELDELHRQLKARHGSYGNSLSSVKMISQAFRIFEKSVQLIEGKVKNFSNTADTMIKDGRYDSRRIRREVDEVEQKWSDFHRSITEYHKALDDSTKFFELMDDCDGWMNGAGQFLLTIGRKATDCKTSQDASNLIKQLVDFKDDGALQENVRLNSMECIATDLYGSVSGPQKMQHTVDRNQETLASFVKAIEELAILRDNLLKKEQILAQMEAVVESKAPRQPRFVQPLQNAEITEGQRFTFECRLECDTKTPTIEWLKDGLPLQNPALQLVYKDGLCQLTIGETVAEDTAKYICRATTEAGTAETFAFLRVKETHQKIIPPDFSRHLRSVEIPEGTALTLECQVSGIPSPTVSWFRDEENIDNSPDFVLTNVGGICCLKIRKAVIEHSAQYTCKASNPGGETASSARVQVITVRKPKFTELLKDTSVGEGKGAILECRFIGEPPPQIQWMKNDVQILPSSDFKIVIKPDYTALHIKEVLPEDAGSYAVIAKNIGGESRTSALLSIEGMFVDGGPRRTPSKPVFVQPLQNKDVQEGSRAHLRCVVQGFPQPEIVWYHNDKIVKDIKDFEVSFDGERCSLLIREVYLEDSGDYRCVARNSQGTAETSCRLVIEPLSELSDASASIPGDVVPPKFTQLLKDIEGVEGELVRFDCRVIGYPTPVIKWYRGRNQVLTSADFLITSERELHSLTIPEAFKEDAGNYVVKATNAAGTAKCYASLIVKQSGDKHMVKTRLVEASHSSQRTIIAGHVPPEFTKLFRDMRVRPGHPCTMEVSVSGHPRPQVRWLFNNEPIVSPDYQISSRGDAHILHIPEVFAEDAGRFSIVAENAAGKATCSALLVVVDESQILPEDDSPPETPQVKHQAGGFGPPPVVPIRPPAPVIAPAPPKPVVKEVVAPPPPPVARVSPPPVYHEQITVPQKAAPKPSPPVSVPFVPKVLPQPPPIPSPIFREELVTPLKASPSFQPVDFTIEIPIPPGFVEPLRNLSAKEGTRATLEGYVQGKPEPTIRWFKEGRELTQSADFEISFRNGRVQLSIPEVFEEDSGKYVCQAQNKAGQAQSTAELIVKASVVPPQFVERLQTKEVKEGEAVRFTVRVSGKPPPEVTWYREGSKIVSSPDFEIFQEGDLHTLYIPEVFYEDSGKFSVQADSKAGQTQCTAELIVEALTVKEESITPSPPASRSPSFDPERTTLHARPVPFSGSSREASPPLKVQFSKPLANRSASEGQRVTLECIIPAYPVPEKVQWFRNEIEIFTSPDYEISFNLGICRLVIAEAFPEDTGKYQCTVTINNLPVSTYMQLTVEAAPKKIPSPRLPPEHIPLFIKQLTNQRLRPSGTAYFECKVDGYPPPEILWTRRGHPLVDKARYKSTYDQYSGITTLTIFNLCNEDEGEYICKAINSLGEASTSATLLNPDRDLDREQQQGIVSQPPPPPAKVYKPPPVVDGRFSDEEQRSEPFKVSHFEKRLTKEIEFRGDKDHPKDFAKEDKEAFDDTPAKEPVSVPAFYQKPENFQLIEGADATFVCKVNARPLPQIQWYHNGRLIRPSNRYIMGLTKDGVCTLTIRLTLPEDAGHYTCCATNNAGRDTCSAELYIEAASAIDETSYVTPETLRRMMRSPAEPRSGSRDLGGVSEKHFKPVFRKIPEDLEVPEGAMARFDSVVSGQPHPDLFWYRDGTEVHDDRYHKIVINEAGINSLIFDVTSRSDTGLYTCVASNAAGKDQFQVRLNVLPRESASLPYFLGRMINQTVTEGQPVTFEVEASGHPVPMISWQRDGRLLSSNDQYRIDTTGGHSSLHIISARAEDNASFQCTAANVAGIATSRTKLTVQVVPRAQTLDRKLTIPRRVITPTADISPQLYLTRPVSEPQKPISSPVPDRKVITPVSFAPPPAEPASHKSTTDIFLAPTPPPKAPSPQPFKHVEAPKKTEDAPPPAAAEALLPQEPVQPLAPASPVPKVESISRPQPPVPLSTISPVLATVDTKARPSPKPAPKHSEVLKYIQDEERAKAAPPPPSPKDVVDFSKYPGEPRVKGPTASAQDLLQKERPRPPKFTTQIKPQVNLSENQPAHFECRLIPVADPEMQVEWYKDDILLRHGHRFRPLHDFGFVSLDILYTYPEDNGTYTCKATNKHGSDSTQAQLQCFGKESVIYASQLPEGSDSVRQIQSMEDAIYGRVEAPREEDQPDRSPPIFDLLLDSQHVEEGETAKFMVKVSGNPRPVVKWSINDSIVCNSQRFRLRYDGMIHILEIPKAHDYDSGSVRVVAKNTLGEAESSATLTVAPRDDWRSRLKQAPKSIVETELDRKKHSALRTFELDQALKKPKTTVVELRAFERSAQEKALTYKDDEVKKAFTNINLRHAQMAKSDASKELRMHEPNVHIESEVHVARAKAMLNIADDFQREEQPRIVLKTQPAKKEVPVFTQPLSNVVAKEGQPAKLEVGYDGFPTPEIHWFREGIEIQPSRDFQITHLYHKSTLVIPEVFLEDAGEFVVKAISAVGAAECCALLVVEEDVNKAKEAPPEFGIQLRDITIQVGEPAAFDCQILGYPRPDVYWTKDGRRIGDSSRCKLIIEDDHYTLLIYEVSPEDAGLYECVVINKLGKATSSGRLNVAGQPAQVKPPSPPASHSAPQLLEPIRDLQANEGDSIQFRCNIAGTPEPVVQWYYNNQIIKPSKYFQMSSENGYHTLAIAGVFPEDEGTYKCTARNPVGEVNSVGHLKVISVTVEPALEPPKFIKPISGFDVIEGGQAVFEVIVTGEPLPEVVWYHEGHQIFHGPDFEILREGNRFLLIIREVLIEDAGIFTCRATNPAGAVECSAELFVEDLTRVATAQVQLTTQPKVTTAAQPREPERRAPRIIQPPKPSQDILAGNTARLEVQVEAYPPPRFNWYVNNQPIQPSQKHRVTYDSGFVVLLVTNAQPQDSGDYVLRAVNELGEITCKTTLNVQPKQKVVQIPLKPAAVTITTSKHVVTKEAVPTFTIPLKRETRAPEHSVAILEAQVNAYPPPRITWHVNGIEIIPSSKYIQAFTGDRSILEIHDVTQMDNGVYTCKASSNLGEAISSTTLHVFTQEPRPVPPKFTKNLENVTATDGREVTLSCVVTGLPMPEVSWYHNHKCIDRSEDFVITYDHQTGRIDLVIVDCLPDDQGRFRCIAKNPGGQAITECTLTVKPAPKSAGPLVEPPKDVKVTIQHQDVTKDTLDIEEQKTVTEKEVTVIKKIVKRISGQPPRFSRPIQPCVVREGESCTFTGVVTGAPQPEITWLKDRVELVITPRHITTFDRDTGTCSLTITYTTPSDIGVYSCRASNIAGRATCTANVVIVPPDAEVMITEKTVSVKKEKVTVVGEQETRVVESSPTFSHTLAPVTDATEGDTIRFECQVSADPEPNVIWLYNGQPLVNSHRVTLTYDKPLTTLTIANVTLDDTGEYTCKAINALGEAFTKTFLRIRRFATEPVHPVAAQQPAPGRDIAIGFVQSSQGVGDSYHQGIPPMPLSEPCSVISVGPPGIQQREEIQKMDGKKVTSTDHSQTRYSEGKCALIIDSVTADDKAEYSCEAENQNSIAATRGEVLVESKRSSLATDCAMADHLSSTAHRQVLCFRSRAY